MYEEVSVTRRVVWAVACFVMIFVVLWGFVWLVFLRHSNPVSKSPHQSSNSTTPQQKSPAATSGGQSSGSTGTSTGGSPATPTQLANAGAGNVVALFVGVTVVSGVAYQIRLRQRLSTKNV